MASQATGGLLKVLSGNQLGAEASIPAGSAWTIGRSEDNDVVLTDAAIASHHAKISVSPSGEFALETLEGGCLVDGKPATSNSIRLNSFQIFTLGSTHLAIARENETWPALRLPVLRSIGGSPAKPPVAAVSAAPAKATLHRGRLLILAGSAAAAIALGAIWFTASEETPQKTRPFVPPSLIAPGKAGDPDQITLARAFREEVQAAVPTAQLQFSFRDGRPAVKVYVENESDAAAVRQLANRLPEPILVSTISRDQLALSLKVFLQANNIRTLTPTITPPANVAWKGYLKNRAEWDSILRMLNSDVAGAHNVDGGIVYGEDLVKTISGILNRANFAGSISPEVTGAGIRLAGNIPASRQEEWTAAKTEIQKAVGNHVPLLSDIGSTVEAAGKELTLDAPIVTVNLDGLPYVQLANGTRLYQGARLPNGYILESLDASKVIFAGPSGRSTIDVFKNPSPTEVAATTTTDI